MKKPFVSLFFTPRKLQILKLNAKKNTVEKYTSVDLPEGLIVNYRVYDKKSLITILQGVWRRLGLKEKSVGIVVPEFSTFTKSLFLPQLETRDLDEAIRWQSHDFLPTGNGHMVMDWKIIQKQKEKLHILAVAMQKKILLSFVDAVGEAGFFPLVVETPSLSLARISDNDSSAKLIIYANFGEAVLALAQGEEIFGSSVIGSSDQNGILWTAKNMTKHYKNIKSKRLEVGGLELSQQLIGNLQDNLAIPVSWIKVNIAGLSAQQIQEYLVPISLQLKDPTEPLDETTVNLLPANWVKYYQNKKLKLQTQSLMLIASAIIWGCFLSSLGIYLTFLRQIKVFQKNNTTHAAVLPKEITTQINQINKLADSIIKVAGISISPQGIANIIAQAEPEGIYISEYQINLDAGKITLKGKAANRQALIDFKQALKEKEDFSEVRLPVSTYEVEENLEFEIRFDYLPKVNRKIIKIPIK